MLDVFAARPWGSWEQAARISAGASVNEGCWRDLRSQRAAYHHVPTAVATAENYLGKEVKHAVITVPATTSSVSP